MKSFRRCVCDESRPAIEPEKNLATGFRARRGFTLVELLVVIAIIGTLVALLLPAVQAARESARRISCSNNLKNIALAVLNHHDSRGHFPLSYGAAWPGEAPVGVEQSAVGWILEILPQLEQQPLQDRFKQAGAYEGRFRQGLVRNPQPGFGMSSKNGDLTVPDLMSSTLPMLTCPSDDSPERVREDQFQWVGVPVAVTSYKGVLGDTWLGKLDGSIASNDSSNYPSGVYFGDSSTEFELDARDCHADTRCRGIFYRQTFQQPVKLKDVTDGTSNTFMIGEDLPDYNGHSAAYYSNGSWSSCNLPPNNLINLNPSQIDLEFWWDQQSFRSRHPAGLQFALVDGSVRFVSDDIDNEYYRTSCTRDGEEALGSGF